MFTNIVALFQQCRINATFCKWIIRNKNDNYFIFLFFANLFVSK